MAATMLFHPRWVFASVLLLADVSPCSHHHDHRRDVSPDLSIEVTCAGAACGTHGELRAVTCAGATSIATKADVRLATGISPVSFAGSPLAPGPLCLEVFLDVDGNGTYGPGDAGASAGGKTVAITPGETASVAFVLDTIAR
jgi:hypothetical protein